MGLVDFDRAPEHGDDVAGRRLANGGEGSQDALPVQISFRGDSRTGQASAEPAEEAVPLLPVNRRGGCQSRRRPQTVGDRGTAPP